jgi:hypothetical protein
VVARSRNRYDRRPGTITIVTTLDDDRTGPGRIRCEELLQAVATCYGPDFREFLHCPTPISHAATKMTRHRVMLQGVPAFIMRVLLAALYFLHY